MPSGNTATESNRQSRKRGPFQSHGGSSRFNMLPDSLSRKDNPNTSSRMGRCSANGDIVWYSSNQHDTHNNVYNQDNHDDKANHNYYKNNHHADHHHQQSPD